MWACIHGCAHVCGHVSVDNIRSRLQIIFHLSIVTARQQTSENTFDKLASLYLLIIFLAN